MWYLLQVGTLEGEICGHQWRELDPQEPGDQALFLAAARGQRPLGDAEAQTRDSVQWDTAAQNRTQFYLGVWNRATCAWSPQVTESQAQALWSAGSCAFEQPEGG